MKKQKIIYSAAVLALVLGSSSAFAERWAVTEGPYGEWKGTWTIDPSRSDFSIILQSQHGTVTADGKYTKSGNTVSIARTGSSDGNDCNYSGTISGKSISGTYFCKNGGPYRWNAVISD